MHSCTTGRSEEQITPYLKCRKMSCHNLPINALLLYPWNILHLPDFSCGIHGMHTNKKLSLNSNIAVKSKVNSHTTNVSSALKIWLVSLLSFQGHSSFGKYNSFWSNIWFHPLAICQRVKGTSETILEICSFKPNSWFFVFNGVDDITDLKPTA